MNGKGRNSKENNLIKQYNTMYFHFKKVTVNNIDEILNKIIEDLETQIRACMQNIHQADLDNGQYSSAKVHRTLQVSCDAQGRVSVSTEDLEGLVPEVLDGE